MNPQRNIDGSLRRIVPEVMVLPAQSTLRHLFFAFTDPRLGSFTPKKYKLNKEGIFTSLMTELASQCPFEGSIVFLNVMPNAVVFESVELKVNHQLAHRFYKQILYIKVTERFSGYRFTLRFCIEEGNLRYPVHSI